MYSLLDVAIIALQKEQVMSALGIAIYLEARYQSWRRVSGHYNAIYGRRSFLLYHPELTSPLYWEAK